MLQNRLPSSSSALRFCMTKKEKQNMGIKLSLIKRLPYIWNVQFLVGNLVTKLHWFPFPYPTLPKNTTKQTNKRAHHPITQEPGLNSRANLSGIRITQRSFLLDISVNHHNKRSFQLTPSSAKLIDSSRRSGRRGHQGHRHLSMELP